jgi:polyvinyl alcohol dehydrogenase (cytochrome)
MRYVCLLGLAVSSLFAQDGAALWKERCSTCHDNPEARVPATSALKAMAPEAVYVALTSGVMKTRAEGLTTPQLFALIGYIAPTGGTHPDTAALTPTCKGDAAFRIAAGAPQSNGWSTSPTNSRFQDAASARLTGADVPKLKLKWAFNLGAVTMGRAQATVAGGRLFLTSQTGAVYSLDAATGCTWWGFQAAAGLRGGVTIGEANGAAAAFFSEAGGTVHALNAATGALLWKTPAANHFATMATATPRYYKGVIYQPFSSFEEAVGADPKYACCTFRGSVVALDATTGKKLWQTYTIPEAAKPTRKNSAGTQLSGPSGAGIWSTPTIDEQLGALYVSTGDNYSDPATDTSDAVLAMDLKTGKLLWLKQLTENDAFNNGCSVPGGASCPEAKGPDYDFGQPPILVQLDGGKRVLVIGQKSGMAHAIDPDQKGKVLWQMRAGGGSALGGSQWGSAADARNIYVAIANAGMAAVADPKSPQGYRLNLDPKQGGGLSAIDLRTGRIVWNAKPTPCAVGRSDCSPAQSAAVTGIPGVVFSGSVDGHLRAFSTFTGEVVWDTDTQREFETVNGKPAHGGSIDVAGPAIANGMVFVNSGYAQWGGVPGNVFLAFSVDGK